MLEDALVALATAGGTAVVQAAGTQAWDGFRARMARLLGRGDGERERAELERLDRTAGALDAPGAAGAEQVRLRQEVAWQTRLEALLEGLAGVERDRFAAELQTLLREQTGAAGGVAAGDGGVAVGGSVEVRADHGSVAALRVGDVTLGNPSLPGPPQG